MTKFYALLVLSSLYLVGCKSASKSYQKGDYADAIELGVKKLQKDPDDVETRNIVQNAYTFAVNEKENQIRILSNSSDENRFENIYRQYLYLQDMHQTIHAYPVASRLIKTKDYSEYIETYRNKAAEVHLARAEEWMRERTKQGNREAYKELNMASSFLPNDFKLKRKKDSVYNEALTKVLVVPMQNSGYQYTSSQQVQNFQRDILRTLSYNMGNDFVRFYSDWELKNKNLKADQTLELNLSRISIGQPYDNRSSREVSREVVVKEIVYRPDSVVKQYGTVRAHITTTQRTLLSEGDLVITIRNPKGTVLWTDRFTGEHRWKTEFSSFTGDERALSDSDRSSLNNNENNTPREEQIMDELFKQIKSDLSNRLRNYYSSY